MSELVLYSYAACPFAQRTRMVLAEKELNFDLHEVDVYNKPEGWEKISPYGKVPCLTHAGGTIYESAIINEYLDESFPEPPLMPPGTLARAQARIWIDYIDRRFLPETHRLVREKDDNAQVAENIGKVHDGMRFMETEGLEKLGNGPYWFGESPALVDFHLLPFVERFSVYEELVGFSWPADCTRLAAWFDAMRNRDSVKPTMRPIEYHLEQQRKLLARFASKSQATG